MTEEKKTEGETPEEKKPESLWVMQGLLTPIQHKTVMGCFKLAQIVIEYINKQEQCPIMMGLEIINLNAPNIQEVLPDALKSQLAGATHNFRFFVVLRTHYKDAEKKELKEAGGLNGAEPKEPSRIITDI